MFFQGWNTKTYFLNNMPTYKLVIIDKIIVGPFALRRRL